MQQVTERSEYVVPGQGHAETILEAFRAWTALNEGSHSETFKGAEYICIDDLMERLYEMPLSILVNYGWVEPGKLPEDGPDEYEILLGTGGPATRIWGKLNQYDEPDTAVLQGQDWFKPWQRTDTTEEQDEAILWFAQQFYFGG